MKIVMIRKFKLLFIFLSFIAAFLLILLYTRIHYHISTARMVMGGTCRLQATVTNDNMTINHVNAVEKYFRPSCLPVLNDRYNWRFFDNYFGKKASEITLPAYLLKTPEEALLNYYSILREAANFEDGKFAGCGTIGYATTPYPVAYSFLSSAYREKLPYKQYMDSFKNILHISLIKYKEVPVYDNPSGILRYFVELETIGGSEKNIANFTYYYGFMDLVKEEGLYKISGLDFYGEDFLCAPYHGWSYDAKGSVEVRYGGWCKLIKKLYPVEQDGYVKHVYFDGTDDNKYQIVFFQLTNDTDTQIAQYRKGKEGNWELIKLNPQKCIKEKAD